MRLSSVFMLPSIGNVVLEAAVEDNTLVPIVCEPDDGDKFMDLCSGVCDNKFEEELKVDGVLAE